MIYENDFASFDIIKDNYKSILKLNIKKSCPNRDEFDQLIEQMDNIYDAFLKSNTKFYLLCNLNELGVIPMTYIKEIASFFYSKHECIEKLLICTSVVISSSSVRTIINGFLYIYTTIKPVKFVKEENESYTFFDSIKFGDTMDINNLKEN